MPKDAPCNPLNTKIKDYLKSPSFQKHSRNWGPVLFKNGLFSEFGLYPVSLRPLVLGGEEGDALRRAATRLGALLERVIELYCEESAVRQFFTAYLDYADLLLLDPGYRPQVAVCRFDCVWAGGDNFQVLETNTACPGGVIQGGLAGRLWHETDFAKELLGGVTVVEQPYVSDPALFVRELLRLLDEAGIAGGTAAVVNLRGVYTNETPHMIKEFVAAGMAALVCDARDFSFREGRLFYKRQPVALSYNKLDPIRLFRDDGVRDYLRAIRERKVCAVNPPAAQLITEDKAVLAFLSDPEQAQYFSVAELKLIAKHIPWTRIVRAGVTSLPDGRKTELTTYIQERQAELVLKPSNQSRGLGVVLGPFVSGARWRETLELALVENYVVQRYLPQPVLNVPDFQTNEIHAMYYSLNLFLFGGKFAGFHARASRDPVTNIARTGCLLPVVQVA